MLLVPGCGWGMLWGLAYGPGMGHTFVQVLGQCRALPRCRITRSST